MGSDVAEERGAEDRRTTKAGEEFRVCVVEEGGWISTSRGACDETGFGGNKTGDLW